jgi:hypothetical protein
MAKLRKRYLVGLILLLSGALATYAWNSLPDGPRWQRGYPQIAVGDSEQKVLEVMGKPSEIKDCERPRYSGNSKLWQKCAEEYWYVTFMQTWAVVIGRDGKVIAKWYNVSP